MYLQSMGNNQDQQEDRLQWMNFICPSCAVAYGISALIKTVKKRRKQVTVPPVD
jgi:hypothetical protein